MQVILDFVGVLSQKGAQFLDVVTDFADELVHTRLVRLTLRKW